MCSTLNFTRQHWSTLAITAQQHCYRGRHIPPNNIYWVSLLCQLPSRGANWYYTEQWGLECVNHPPPWSSGPQCAQWGHTKVHFPFGSPGSPSCYHYAKQLILTRACHPAPSLGLPVCKRRGDTVLEQTIVSFWQQCCTGQQSHWQLQCHFVVWVQSSSMLQQSLIFFIFYLKLRVGSNASHICHPFISIYCLPPRQHIFQEYHWSVSLQWHFSVQAQVQ